MCARSGCGCCDRSAASRELSAALEKDAGALQGEARLAVLAEHATLLEAAGEAEKALDVRLMALAEFPGAPPCSTTRAAGWTRRAAPGSRWRWRRPRSSTPPTSATAAASLLRDVASADRDGRRRQSGEAAEAWLAVLELDPGDAHAARLPPSAFCWPSGDWERCAELLAWSAARAPTLPAGAPRAGGPPSRAALLWRLAELRRARLGQIDEALRLYGELGAASRSRAAGRWPIRRRWRRSCGASRCWRWRPRGPPWRRPRPIDRGRCSIARAPSSERGRGATTPSATSLAALDLDPHNMEALSALEKLFEEPRAPRLLVDELGRRAAKLAARGRGAALLRARGAPRRARATTGAAREAYRRAMSLDPTLAEPIAALGALAAKEGDWSEVAKLLESEVGLTTSSARKGALLLELAVVQGDRLGAPAARRRAARRRPRRHLRDEPRVLDLRARFNLAAGNWQAAARGARPAGRAQRGHPRRGRALLRGRRRRGGGRRHRSRAHPLLAFLFARQLVSPDAGAAVGDLLSARAVGQRLEGDRGAARSPRRLASSRGPRATLLVRSALADLHVGQRVSAVAKLGEIVTRGPSYVAGRRHPRRRGELGGHAPRAAAAGHARGRGGASGSCAARGRRSRSPTGETDAARRQALEILGALAMVDGRWEEAFSALEALGADATFEPQRRAEFLVGAGDVMLRHYGDRDVAEPFYRAGPSALARPPTFRAPRGTCFLTTTWSFATVVLQSVSSGRQLLDFIEKKSPRKDRSQCSRQYEVS